MTDSQKLYLAIEQNMNPDNMLDLIMNLHEQTHNTFNSESLIEYYVELRDELLNSYAKNWGVPQLFLEIDKRNNEMLQYIESDYQKRINNLKSKTG